MADKRKKRGFFDDIFGDSEFNDIEDIIEHMMERLGFNLEDFDKQPFFYGFSVSGHPGEEPEIREFGNVFPDDEDDEFESVIQQYKVDERKPLMDIFEIDGKVHVTIELCDVEKEDINLSLTETVLELKAQSERVSYSESITLPLTVDPDTVKANYNNGVLDVKMDVKELGVVRTVHID
ncbi:MAG: Hsp20 family protein [Methanolobus sp.]